REGEGGPAGDGEDHRRRGGTPRGPAPHRPELGTHRCRDDGPLQPADRGDVRLEALAIGRKVAQFVPPTLNFGRKIAVEAGKSKDAAWVWDGDAFVGEGN